MSHSRNNLMQEKSKKSNHYPWVLRISAKIVQYSTTDLSLKLWAAKSIPPLNKKDRKAQERPLLLPNFLSRRLQLQSKDILDKNTKSNINRWNFKSSPNPWYKEFQHSWEGRRKNNWNVYTRLHASSINIQKATVKLTEILKRQKSSKLGNLQTKALTTRLRTIRNNSSLVKRWI